jgi:hypothetical protein
MAGILDSLDDEMIPAKACARPCQLVGLTLSEWTGFSCPPPAGDRKITHYWGYSHQNSM